MTPATPEPPAPRSLRAAPDAVDAAAQVVVDFSDIREVIERPDVEPYLSELQRGILAMFREQQRQQAANNYLQACSADIKLPQHVLVRAAVDVTIPTDIPGEFSTRTVRTLGRFIPAEVSATHIYYEADKTLNEAREAQRESLLKTLRLMNITVTNVPAALASPDAGPIQGSAYQVTNPIEHFHTWIESALQRSEAGRLQLGNVSFGISNGNLIFDLPTDRWDVQALARDLTPLLDPADVIAATSLASRVQPPTSTRRAADVLLDGLNWIARTADEAIPKIQNIQPDLDPVSSPMRGEQPDTARVMTVFGFAMVGAHALGVIRTQAQAALEGRDDVADTLRFIARYADAARPGLEGNETSSQVVAATSLMSIANLARETLDAAAALEPPVPQSPPRRATPAP